MGAGHSGRSTLVGRDAEHRAVLELVARLRGGHGGGLVLRGECGMGKTFLAEHAVESVPGVRVVRTPGIEAEALLPYAALDRLLRPWLDRLPDLPVRQRKALDTVFGERLGATSPAAVAVATSALLDLAAGGEPVLHLVDDAQWIDRATGEILCAVRSAGRQAGRSFLFCARDRPEPVGWLGQWPEVRLSPLDHHESMMLLASLSEDVDPFPARRLVRVAGGNPLALTRFVRNYVAGHGYHRAWPNEWFRLPERLETELLRSTGECSARARLLLLLAAVEPSATMADFRTAARVVGTEVDPDEVVDLVTFEPHPVFRQPLLPLALARRATAVLRHRIHVVLGLVLDDADRRAWHAALSAHGHDETIAGELEAAARRAEIQGRHRRAETYFRRSAEVGNVDRRAGRLVSAARLALLTKNYRLTGALLDEALLTPLDAHLRPEISRIRAVLYARAGDDRDILLALSDVLDDMGLLDVRAAGDTWFETLDGALLAQGQLPHTTLCRLARHALDAAPTHTGQQTPVDVLAAGLAMRVTAGYEEAVPLMRRIATTLDTVDDADPAGRRCRRWHSLIALTLLELWDIERGARLSDQAARGIDVRILRVTPFALAQGHATRWDSGAVTVPHTGSRRLVQIAVEAVAGTGRGTAEARAKAREVITLARRAGYGFLVSLCHLLLARIAISRGEYDEALVWSRLAYTEDAPGLGGQVLADLVESAVRVGDAAVAAAAYDRLAVRVGASDSVWGRGLQARAQALSVPDTHAERYFQTAIRLLEPTAAVLDTGRTQLLYGEWLRRRKRRTEAAHHLGRAYRTFVAVAADAFAERARAELDAAGARPEGKHDLTAQQRRVAQLAVEGLTRAQMAVRLAISEHTVADHLKQVYRKFGVHSRGQLSEVFTNGAGDDP
ncbi:LuxR family transcriptional regulator [Actinophytocola sp.]|uniref:helix-turn-helix transcriptional regulator n=1 Tax=Actinophytocola sp. TaxID=1872138 RepID=UPI002D3828E7|nr:LuxR family transcriptional regulator [Actinophytocola sp.]HYQ64452.1 LuxR family transcriptional regulator [Actinophytocola sp.]